MVSRPAGLSQGEGTARGRFASIECLEECGRLAATLSTMFEENKRADHNRNIRVNLDVRRHPFSLKEGLSLFSPLTLTLSPLRGEGTVRGRFASIECLEECGRRECARPTNYSETRYLVSYQDFMARQEPRPTGGIEEEPPWHKERWEVFPPPRWGGFVFLNSIPRVPLRSTRGYRPASLRMRRAWKLIQLFQS
jgi:hypothetical protein